MKKRIVVCSDGTWNLTEEDVGGGKWTTRRPRRPGLPCPTMSRPARVTLACTVILSAVELE